MGLPRCVVNWTERGHGIAQRSCNSQTNRWIKCHRMNITQRVISFGRDWQTCVESEQISDNLFTCGVARLVYSSNYAVTSEILSIPEMPRYIHWGSTRPTPYIDDISLTSYSISTLFGESVPIWTLIGKYLIQISTTWHNVTQSSKRRVYRVRGGRMSRFIQGPRMERLQHLLGCIPRELLYVLFLFKCQPIHLRHSKCVLFMLNIWPLFGLWHDFSNRQMSGYDYDSWERGRRDL